MAKIGTAHVEIKPVLDEAALDAICARIEARVRESVARAGASSDVHLHVAGSVLSEGDLIRKVRDGLRRRGDVQ